MSHRKPFIVVNQKDVTEFDSLDEAIRGIEESRLEYHKDAYRRFDFEGGIYQIVKDDSSRKINLSNQREYDQRYDEELKPFAVVDKAHNENLIGVKVSFQGRVLELGKDVGLPETEYHGFDTLDEARAEFNRRKDNEAGLYSLVVFQKVAGPDRQY